MDKARREEIARLKHIKRCKALRLNQRSIIAIRHKESLAAAICAALISTIEMLSIKAGWQMKANGEYMWR